MLSSKLTVGVHILTVMATLAEKSLTSEFIAGSVNTNPVVIRRLLGLLRGSGIVESQGGLHGGWRLKVDPGRITLLAILRAVEPKGETIALHRNQPNPNCRVGRNIQKVLAKVYGDVERQMDGQLAWTTIAEVLGLIQAQERG